jgi:pilus assembly protein Flp/PilA
MGRSRSLGKEGAMTQLHQLLRDESGATSIEYALIASLIAIAIFASIQTFTDSLNGVWTYVADNVDPAM